MAIILNDNIKINAGKPSESKYLNSSNLAYSSTTEASSAIPVSERYLGLTVLIDTGTSSVEYWWRESVTGTTENLIEKKFASEQVVGDFITGATNLGYFSGQTGVQRLNLSGFPIVPTTFDGYYYSEYQWYYADSGGIIRIGSPTNGAPFRRGYVNSLRTKSWIWDVGTSAWILSWNDIAANVGNSTNPYTYAGTGYTQTTWATGFQGNGSTSIIGSGSLTTGDTLTRGNPIYKDKSDQKLHLRTIINETPEFLNIESDDNFIRFSGATSALVGQNLGAGAYNIFTGKTGSIMSFRTLTSSGDTTITENADGSLTIYSSSDGSANALTGATNIGAGVGFYSGTTDRNMHFRTIVGTGSTIITASGDTIIVDSSSGGVYDLASPSAIPVGGICSGTVLTGKTSFELWEELLVPELCGSVVEPNVSSVGLTCSGLEEIGDNISQTVTINFSRGSISPQYDSITPYRSDGANAYCFCGCGMSSGFQACTALSMSITNASYDVVIGTQTWGGCVRYDSGNAALSSKGNEYCAALSSGCTNIGSNSIVGVYPLYGTTSTISALTPQGLQNMSTANNILVSLVAESGGNKQKFEIPCAWLGAPTSRPLVGVCQWNTVSSQWEYPGDSAVASLTLWTPSSTTENVQGNSVGYCQYTYNSVDRSAVCIRLVFKI